MSSEEVTTGHNLGFQIFPTLPVTFPTYYDGGLRAALGVLTRSNRQDKYEAKQNVFSSHKSRWVHANIYMANASDGETLQVIWIDKGLQVMASSPTDSEWFTHFTTGLSSRIGERI